MKTYKYIFIITTSLLIIACKKPNVSENKNEIKNTTIKEKIIQSAISSAARNAGVINWQEVYDKISDSLAGIFGFSTYRSFFTNYTNGRIQGSYRSPFISQGQSVILNSVTNLAAVDTYNFLLNSDAAIIPLYGNSVNIDIGFRINNNQYVGSKSMELCSKLEILSDNNFSTGQGILQNGTSISWTLDNSNTDSYIIVAITYDPNDIDNAQIGSTDPIYNNFLLADNGNYIFTTEDIKMFPDDAFVKINFYRLQFTIGTHVQSERDFAFGGYSCFQLSGRINR
ncbi:MAG TPA: hypothetical protein V6C58_24030 [Allocoleopsis sp.]